VMPARYHLPSEYLASASSPTQRKRPVKPVSC